MTTTHDLSAKVAAQQLRRLVGAASVRFESWSDDDARMPFRPGGWSRQELVGHLIDSATNNHQRFVRAQLERKLVFPKYDQDGWVSTQGYADANWRDVVSLWRHYNLWLAEVIDRIPPDQLTTKCVIGPEPEATLGFLVDDYVNHLEHHLRQLGVDLA